MSASWLDDFIAYSAFCEASPRMMYWVGISTIAGALRRKVWIEEEYFKWTPNFYILLVGPPGVVKKSTSINIGYSMLSTVPGINFGPDSVTWQALISDMCAKPEMVMLDDEALLMSCVTLGIDEFGAFYDPTDRSMTDLLTHLWDCRARPFVKSTKGGGQEVIENPWINLIGCTTPSWLTANMSEAAAGGGLASRFIYLYEDGSDIKDVSYPSRAMRDKKERVARDRANLIARLTDIADYKGRYTLTDAAYEWGDTWYLIHRKALRDRGLANIDAWFSCRQQTMLHKIAMVLSAAKGKFPVIDVDELKEAQQSLNAVSLDAARIFGYVGQVPLGKATQDIIEMVENEGPIEKRAVWRAFYRKLKPHEFEEILHGALATGFIVASGPLANPILHRQEPLRGRTVC